MKRCAADVQRTGQPRCMQRLEIAITGAVDGGPPVRPLDHFYTRMRNGQVEVGPRYSVNSSFDRFPSYRDPGQPLDGIGQYLYPGRFSTPKNP